MGPTVTAHTEELDIPGLCQTIAEASPLPTAAVEGANHLVTYANPALCRLVGRSKEELLGTVFAGPERAGEECLLLLDLVYRTGQAATHIGQDSSITHPFYWSYAMWPVTAVGGDLLESSFR